MIKLSVNETKWSSFLARTGALILFISIRIFNFGREKLPGLSRNGPKGFEFRESLLLPVLVYKVSMALFVSLLFAFMLPLFWAKYKGFLALAVGNLTYYAMCLCCFPSLDVFICFQLAEMLIVCSLALRLFIPGYLVDAPYVFSRLYYFLLPATIALPSLVVLLSVVLALGS